MSQDTLFSTGSEDSNISYVRLTPYGELEEDRMDNKDVPPKLFHRPRLDSLSVPNLVNQYLNAMSTCEKNFNKLFFGKKIIRLHTDYQKM